MAESTWPQAPAEPTLLHGVVEVWRADLRDFSRGEGALLSGPEFERAARFVRPGDGERWGLARGILRALIARYSGTDPRTVHFVEGWYGKPELAGDESLRFNVSHSGDVALYALAFNRDVGVDVELPRRSTDHVAVGRRVFGDAEAERLQALEPQEREREFLRLWTRWEAALKCHGAGIGGAEAMRDIPQPWIQELELGRPGAAAVAVAGGPCPVRCWQWPAFGA